MAEDEYGASVDVPIRGKPASTGRKTLLQVPHCPTKIATCAGNDLNPDPPGEKPETNNLVQRVRC
jgi:hypothetical protein